MSAVHEPGPRGGRPRQNKGGIDVRVDNHWSSKAYTSGATIKGHVVINTQQPVPFDDFEIVFTGTAYTRVDFVNQFASYASRPFMKLRMPIPASDFPNPRVFEAGRTYNIPFHFVVPQQLTLSACSHHVESPAVRDAHLRLPPTMGFWEADDQSPDMAHIEYAVRAMAFHDTSEGRTSPLETSHMVKVLPALPEDAPLDVTAKDERYQLAKGKTIRKNIFSAKQGKLLATASQPGAVMLAADTLKPGESLLHVDLDFDPSTASSAPPKINSVSAKLHSTTFFSNAPMSHTPSMGVRVKHQTNPILTYSTTHPMEIPKLGPEITWHVKNGVERHDPVCYSSGSSPDTSDSESGKKKPSHQFATSLDIPFTLPTANKKIFLPTFNSCISSRAYVINLTLNVGPMNAAINLNVPLQVAVENTFVPQDDELPSFETAMAEAEAEDADMHLQPRLMQVPETRFQGTSNLPGYADLVSRQAVPAN